MYNAERFLSEAIESILNQTFRDYEFIIFDDGSTDKSVVITESYNDPRICLIKSSHIGRAAALNKAIKYATTDLIAFMDSDDVSMKTRLEEQMSFLKNNSEIGVIGCWAERIDEDGNSINHITKPENHDEIEYHMTRICTIRFPGCIIKKILVQEIGGFNESLIAAVDYELFLRLLPLTRFYNIQHSLIKYRNNSKSITAIYGQVQDRTQVFYSKRYLLSLINDISPLKKRAIIYRRMGICEYYHGTMNGSRKHLFKAFIYGDISFQNLRYLLPTFIGNTLFKIYRENIYHKIKKLAIIFDHKVSSHKKY